MTIGRLRSSSQGRRPGCGPAQPVARRHQAGPSPAVGEVGDPDPVGRRRLELPGQLIHHHDAGSQYTALRFTEHLALEAIAPSIGTVGDAYDNGLMESIIGLFKTECIRTTIFHPGPYKTLADIEYATAGWVDWYNHRRLHGSLGMVPPAEYEHAHYAALNPEKQPV